MKNIKAPEKGRIMAEMRKYEGKTVINTLHILLNKILKEKSIPNNWKELYRRLTLLSVISKLLAK